jgi:hypothetical protein
VYVHSLVPKSQTVDTSKLLISDCPVADVKVGESANV